MGCLAASALWMLVEVEATRARLPVAQYVPPLLQLARRAAASRATLADAPREGDAPSRGAPALAPELAMAPVGALSRLIALPAGLKAFSDLEGERLLLHLLKLTLTPTLTLTLTR